MNRERAIRFLFVFWVAFALLVTMWVSLQILAGRYGTDGQIALNWFLGQFAPVLSILLAAVFAQPSKRWRECLANQWRFRWSVAISAFQVSLMIGCLLIQPIFDSVNISPFVIFENTQAFVSILQGIAVAAVGSVIFDGR
jgi:hypothetical protein